MTPLTPAQLHAEQLRATLAAKLPTSVAFDVCEAAGLRSFIAARQAWIDANMKPLVDETKA